MTARRTVALLVGLTVVYMVLLGWRGLLLLGDPRPAVKLFGAAVLVFPVVGVILLAGEVRFGRRTQQLGAELDARLVRAPKPDENQPFQDRAGAVEATPEDWRAWYLLAEAYGQAGDSARGRKAMKRAITLHKRSQPA